ncbi:hypothetical protein [Delftia acidovorans]|jgi:hypothetical protein|uniref:hypothetical protein n=1 Tax=Delftia acidovorans TaxID=80866 RepID=UPI00286ED9FD|nr:hypothetical protein [Delftia acidovorans]
MAKPFRWTRAKYKRARHLARLFGGLLNWRSKVPALVLRYQELEEQYPNYPDLLLTPLRYRAALRFGDVPF